VDIPVDGVNAKTAKESIYRSNIFLSQINILQGIGS